jgi:hypothetical protein
MTESGHDTAVEAATDETCDEPVRVYISMSGSEAYHLSEDCARLPDSHKSMRKAVAEAWDTLRVCTRPDCAGTAGSPDASDAALCDRCGHCGARLTPNLETDRLCHGCLQDHDRKTAQTRYSGRGRGRGCMNR